MSIEDVEIVDTNVEPAPPPEPVSEEVDEVRPDGPGSGRSDIRKSLEKGFADERRREQRDRNKSGRYREQRAADEYRQAGEEAISDQTQEPETPPPEAWTRDAKAEWANLPSVIQQAVLKREQDTTRGVEELKQRYADLDNALAPRLDLIRRHNHTPGQAVNQLFAWFDALGQDVQRVNQGQEATAFLALAKSFGLDPTRVFGQMAQQPSQQIDPRQAQAAQQAAQQQGRQAPAIPEPLRPLFENMAQLNARLQQQEQYYNQKLGTLESTFQAQTQAKTEEMLASWAKDKPYYEDVRQMMARLIASYAVPLLPNGSADLDKAYEMAVYAMPEVRTKILAEQQAKEEAARQAKIEAEKKAQADAAAKARKAAGGLAPSAPGADISHSKRKGSGKSVRDSLQEAWDEARR